MSSPQINWFKRILGFGPYFRRRSGDLEGIAVASFVGVISGVYIFKPILDEMAINRAEREKLEAMEVAAKTANPPSSSES